MPDNYYSEVNDHGNVIPIRDLAAVAWADAGKSVKKNKMVFDVQATSLNNVTLTINSDNTYTANTGSGGASGLTTIRVGYITEAGRYRLNGCPEGGGDSTYRLDVRPNGATTPMTGSIDTGTGSAVINVTSGDLPASVTMRIPSGATISNKLFKPMVRNADIVDDTFEKTIPDNTELMTWEANAKTGARNILYPLFIRSGTSSTGISYVMDVKGCKLNGEANANFNIKYAEITLKPGTYIYTDDVETSDTTYFVNVAPNPETGSGNFNLNTKPYEFTLSEVTTFTFTIYVRSGQNLSDLQFKPQICVSDDALSGFTEPTFSNEVITDKLITRVLTSNDDLDNIKAEGDYLIQTTPAHAPDSVNFCRLVVKRMNSDDNSVIQIINYKNAIYHRSYGGVTPSWESWFKFTGTALT